MRTWRLSLKNKKRTWRLSLKEKENMAAVTKRKREHGGCQSLFVFSFFGLSFFLFYRQPPLNLQVSPSTMKFKILFILLLLITTTDQVPLSRGERAIFFPLVVVGIASLIITPIIVGSVTAGYFMLTHLETKTANDVGLWYIYLSYY